MCVRDRYTMITIAANAESNDCRRFVETRNCRYDWLKNSIVWLSSTRWFYISELKCQHFRSEFFIFWLQILEMKRKSIKKIFWHKLYNLKLISIFLQINIIVWTDFFRKFINCSSTNKWLSEVQYFFEIIIDKFEINEETRLWRKRRKSAKHTFFSEIIHFSTKIEIFNINFHTWKF
jgi:hypothetical protein